MTNPTTYAIYRGEGGPQNIDWQHPVAEAIAGENIELGETLVPGRRVVYAARAISPRGVEEMGAHVLAIAEIDAAGRLRPALPRPVEVAVWPASAARDGGDGGGARVIVGFSCRPSAGEVRPDGFEILADRGQGLDQTHPLLAIACPADFRGELELAVMPPADCRALAVRAVKSGSPGPCGALVPIRPAHALTPVGRLPA